MRIYFSGGRGLGATPENLVPERKPHIMLTYHDIDSPGTLDRLNVYLQRVTGERYRDKDNEGKILPEHYSEHIFMDSGAYSLYNGQVLKRTVSERGEEEWRESRQHQAKTKQPLRRKAKLALLDGDELALDTTNDTTHFAELSPHSHVRGEGDYSYYSLEQGSEFRKYCDRYAKFMKRMMDWKADLLFTNVDAIHNAEITWKIQKYFEDEHGLFPVPVVHAGASMKYVERYLDSKKYPLLGMGGLGHSIDLNVYMRWADEVFTELCPRSNNYLPTSRTHGFAMTAWKLIDRWPWWSVDSATWVKLSAYGWLYVPRWTEGKWRFDKPPIQINLSAKSPFIKKVNKHIDNTDKRTQELIQRWLKRCGMVEGTVDKDGEMIEFGVRSHFRARSICNLYYLKDLEESRPKWPHRLSEQITGSRHVKYHKGFGFI